MGYSSADRLHLLSLDGNVLHASATGGFPGDPSAVPAAEKARAFAANAFPRLEIDALGDGRWEYDPATLGASGAMRRLRSQVRRIAPYFRTAIVTGPQGSGLEGVARMLHAFSPGAEPAFLSCDAATLAESMLRQEGMDMLATVGASIGGGTVFLSDIADVPPTLQGILLRIWSMNTCGRIRVVAGTACELRTLGITGQLRQDLVQSLSGVEISLPPLCDRPEDLPAVFEAMLRIFGGSRAPALSEEAQAILLEHGWPGDLDEVESVLRTAMRQADGTEAIRASDLPELGTGEDDGGAETGTDRLEDVVQQHVLAVLTRCGGNKVRAAEILGISRSTLYRMLETRNGEGLIDY